MLGLGKVCGVVEARLDVSSWTFLVKVEETAVLWHEESARAGTPHLGNHVDRRTLTTRKLFRNWCAWVHAMRGQTGEPLEPMARATRMVEGHLEGILAHWA